VRRHAHLVGLRHLPALLGAVLVAALLAGCGGKSPERAAACTSARHQLDAAGPTVRKRLIAVILADRRLADSLDPDSDDALRLSTAAGVALRSIAQLASDPRESGTMSTTQTVKRVADRLFAASQAYLDRLC